MIVRRIGVWSVGKLMGMLYALLGLIFGLIVALVSMIGMSLSLAQESPDAPAWLGALFGVGAIVFLPILYGVMGFLGGMLMAALYNLVAGMVGGVELETEQVPGR